MKFQLYRRLYSTMWIHNAHCNCIAFQKRSGYSYWNSMPSLVCYSYSTNSKPNSAYCSSTNSHFVFESAVWTQPRFGTHTHTMPCIQGRRNWGAQEAHAPPPPNFFKGPKVTCEQAHWEKGEPARNHAFYSASTAINKLSTVKLTQGCMYNKEMYITIIQSISKLHNILNIEFSR